MEVDCFIELYPLTRSQKAQRYRGNEGGGGFYRNVFRWAPCYFFIHREREQRPACEVSELETTQTRSLE